MSDCQCWTKHQTTSALCDQGDGRSHAAAAWIGFAGVKLGAQDNLLFREEGGLRRCTGCCTSRPTNKPSQPLALCGPPLTTPLPHAHACVMLLRQVPPGSSGRSRINKQRSLRSGAWGRSSSSSLPRRVCVASAHLHADRTRGGHAGLLDRQVPASCPGL